MSLKMMSHRYSQFFFIVFALCAGAILYSCSEDEEKKKKEPEAVSEMLAIETLFDQDSFDDASLEGLLKELNLCNDTTKSLEDYMNPACSPRFFRFFKLTEKTPYQNGFILQVKSKVSGFPLRRLLIFVRENGQLVKVNGFVANLIGRRKTDSAYDDLLLRFNDNVDGEITFYNCFYRWNGTKYEFLSVEVIEGANWGGAVKSELKDSMGIEIQKEISDNGMLF
jgi:hypothetical protein